MKIITGYLVIISTLLLSCNTKNKENATKSNQIPIAGTWQLITGSVIDKGDTAVTD